SKGVRWSIKRSPLLLILLICIYVGTFGLFKAKPAGFIPTEDAGLFLMGVTLPEGSASVRTTQTLDEIEAELKALAPEINNITQISGINLLNRSFKSNGATF